MRLSIALIVVATVAAGCLAPAADVPLPATAQDGASEFGRWTDVIEGEVPAVSMAVLQDGRVLYWSGVEAGHEDNVFFLSHPHVAQTRVLDLAGGTVTVLTPTDPQGGGDDLFCVGHAILPDGRVLAAGGTDWTTMPGSVDILRGSEDARVFDADADGWVRVADMAHGRWYPSALTLPDGRALVASGIANLTNPVTLQDSMETWDGAAWSDAGSVSLPMYPRLNVVPAGPFAGRVFYSTNGALWGPFGEHPAEAAWSLEKVIDPATGEWRDVGPSLFGARQHAVTIMLPLDPADGYRAELLTFGGTLQRTVVATPLAEVSDLSTDPPTRRVVDALEHPRWHANGVLLPTGEVLAVGGGLYDNVVVHGQPNVPVLAAEIYDPDADAWTTLADMQVPRMYHSTAALLPDGRVLAGGHVPLPVPWTAVRENVPGEDQIVETRLEVFEPPYLHRGERPAILGAPEVAGYAQTFAMGVTFPGEIESVVLVRPAATTHSYDSSGRLVRLEFERAGASLIVESPPDANVAPPGPYMMFVNRATDAGPVPSEAWWITVG